MPVKFTEHRASHINDLLKVLAAHLLFEEGLGTFEFSNEFIESEPWRDIDITWTKDEIKDCWRLRLIDKRKRRIKDDIVDVDYEVVEEPTQLPANPKLITRGNLNDGDASPGSEETLD